MKNTFILFGLILLFYSCSYPESQEKVYTNDDLTIDDQFLKSDFKPEFQQMFRADAQNIFKISNNNSLPSDSIVITKMDSAGNVISELKTGMGNSKIKKVYLSDLDDDRYGEVIVFAHNQDTNLYQIYVTEYRDDSPLMINTIKIQKAMNALRADSLIVTPTSILVGNKQKSMKEYLSFSLLDSSMVLNRAR